MSQQKSTLFSFDKRPIAAAITVMLLTATGMAASNSSADPGANPVANPGANPETSADASPEPAKQLDELVVVGTIGRNEEIDLGTLRGKVIDLPQTLNVISQQTLEQRQVTTLGDALRNVAGVTTQVGEGGVVSGDQFLIRGQSARNDVFTDGLRDFGVFTRDSFNYEAVQVLKGSSSTALGRGVAGGAINTQSKRAILDDSTIVSGGFGSEDYYRVAVDSNFALGETNALRINLMGHQNDGVDRDNQYSERFGFAPTIAFGIDTDTRIDLIYFHQKEDRRVDYGVPIAVTTRTDDIERPVTEFGVARSNFYGFKDDLDEVEVNTFTARLTHQASEWLELSSDLKFGYYTRDFRQTVPGCAAACGDALVGGNTTTPVVSASVRGQQRSDTRGVQNVSTALINAPLFGRRSELVLGWDLSYQKNDREDDVRPTAVNQNLFRPVLYSAPVSQGQVFQARENRIRDLAIFVDERLWLNDFWSLNAGFRYQDFSSTQRQSTRSTNTGAALTTCNGVNGTTPLCVSNLRVDENLFNPKAAVIWEPSETVSLYGSVSRASVPQGNSVNNGDTLTELGAGNSITRDALKPEESETIDLGAKASFFRERLLLQASLYQIDRNNATEVDPLSNFIVASVEPKQRLRGVEVGATGTIGDLDLNFNYSYVDAEIKEAFTGTPPVLDTASLGKQVRYVPKNAASTWLNYIPTEGALVGFEFGGGVNYQSQVFLNSQNTQVVPSFAAFDAMVAYNFPNVRLSINGFNLGDKLYYANVNGGRVVPAAGRSYLLNASVKF